MTPVHLILAVLSVREKKSPVSRWSVFGGGFQVGSLPSAVGDGFHRAQSSEQQEYILQV